MITVLIVDDSQTTLEYLKTLLAMDDGIVVAGIASNGREAVDFSARKRPDVILMDIHMPHMNGFEATRLIMENNPAPIVIMSSVHNIEDTEVVFRAMEAGAVALANKPCGIGHPDHESTARELIQTVKLMSEIKVIRRIPIAKTWLKEQLRPYPVPETSRAGINVVAMGASAGGPPVLQSILSCIPENFPAPIMVVQHIAEGFLEGMIEWLQKAASIPIRLAIHDDPLLPGYVYFAPDNCHMGVNGSTGRIVLSRGNRECGARPSISFLFRSVAMEYRSHAVGVLLTGMGRDGADGLKLLKEQGAVTIVQDKASCLVQGMAGEAIKLNGAMHELHYDNIAPALISLLNHVPIVNGGNDHGK